MSALIQMHDLSKHYGSGSARVNALKDLNLEIERGEFTALSGPSGSGKSTLLNICGLIDPFDQGAYFLDNHDVSKMTDTELTLFRREKLGFIFQNFNLVPVMSAAENVEYPLLLQGIPAAQRHSLVSEMMAQVGLSSEQNRRPDQLSGGQRQRVAIARALVKKPALVIADEPTANLDTKTATQVIDLMKTLGSENQTTFVIATHDSRMTAHCDRILELTDGCLS